MTSWEVRVQNVINQIPGISPGLWENPSRDESMYTRSYGPTRRINERRAISRMNASYSSDRNFTPHRSLKKAGSSSDIASMQDNDGAEIKRLRAMLLDRDRENCELYMQLSTYKKILHQFTHRHQAKSSTTIHQPRRREGFMANAFSIRRRHQEQERMLELMSDEIERLRMQLILSEAERGQGVSDSDFTEMHDTLQTQDEIFGEFRTDELMELLSASHCYPDTSPNASSSHSKKNNHSKSLSRFRITKSGSELSRSSWRQKAQKIKPKRSSKWFFGGDSKSSHHEASHSHSHHDPSLWWHQSRRESKADAGRNQSFRAGEPIRRLDAKQYSELALCIDEDDDAALEMRDLHFK